MRDSAYYRAEAAKFRKLADESDEATAAALGALAEDYDREADRLAHWCERPAADE